jgi:hypothetical protein
MTGIQLQTVQNALRVLKKANEIEGIEPAEYDYPILVTSVVWR